MLPEPSYAPFFPSARALLTGNPFGTTPSPELLTFHAKGALAELVSELPGACAQAWRDYEPGSDDETAFNEAVGAKIAGRIFDSPAGTEFLDNITEVKTGTVVEKFANQTIDGVISKCNVAAENAKKRLSCVIAANSAAGPVQMAGFAGRARSCRFPYGGFRGYSERERY